MHISLQVATKSLYKC